MTHTYDLKIGRARIRAKLDSSKPNFDRENRDYILLSVLAKTINYRKHGSHSWLSNDDNAYDFAMEVYDSIRRLDCFNCSMEFFEMTMQNLVNKRLNDYATASHSGEGKKAAAVGSTCDRLCSFDSDSDKTSTKDNKTWQWGEVLSDDSVVQPDIYAMNADAAHLATQHMKKMPRLMQKCLDLHSQGYSNVEIAKKLNIDKSYVGKLIKQGTISLYADLGDILR